MKAALLVCDHVPKKFSDEFGDYVDMFARLLPEIELDPYFVVDGQFPLSGDHHSYIITGSKSSVYEDIAWINDLKRFVHSAFLEGKKLVGICFGHQLIAEALGGKVGKSDFGYRIGVHTFDILKEKPWLISRSAQLRVLMLCQDEVLKLPANAEVLARSSQCPVGMYVIGSTVFCIQGHPEFEKEYNQAVFESRKDKMGEEKIIVALESLSMDPDRLLLVKSIMGFLKGGRYAIT